jgi:hypothetical protein
MTQGRIDRALSIASYWSTRDSFTGGRALP